MIFVLSLLRPAFSFRQIEETFFFCLHVSSYTCKWLYVADVAKVLPALLIDLAPPIKRLSTYLVLSNIFSKRSVNIKAAALISFVMFCLEIDRWKIRVLSSLIRGEVLTRILPFATHRSIYLSSSIQSQTAGISPPLV